jgi:hypothetical protein
LVGTSSLPQSRLHSSSILLALAACCLTVVWLTEVAGDPTGGVAFYTFGFAGALLVGVALTIAAWSRRDVFGTLGRVGALLLLVTSVTGFFPAMGAGVILIAVAVARTQPLLPGLVLLLIGLVGMFVRAEFSDDAYLIFLPVLIVGSAILAVTLRQV